MILMFPYQNPSVEEHAWKTEVSLLMLLPTYLSYAILMHTACVHPMPFPCM